MKKTKNSEELKDPFNILCIFPSRLFVNMCKDSIKLNLTFNKLFFEIKFCFCT